ncbi:hypothetical protein TNCV_462891, partial [Trichonephila clavipes]
LGELIVAAVAKLVKEPDTWVACHEFEPSTSEHPKYAECLFMVWSSMLFKLVFLLGWSVLAVDDAGVVVH